MKRLYKNVTFITLISVLFASCYYDNEEALYPMIDTTCDTTIVTFSSTIVSILTNNCYSCHSNKKAAANGNNIYLENYSDVVTNAPQVSESIKHSGSISPMPKNGGKLKPCYIMQFDIWVRDGMLNN